MQNNLKQPLFPSTNIPQAKTKIKGQNLNPNFSKKQSSSFYLPNFFAKKFPGGKYIPTIFALLTLIGGIISGLILVQRQQDIREKAKEICQNECPNKNNILKICNSEEKLDFQEFKCDKKGLIKVCNKESFCCPEVGAKWTKDLSSCQKKINN